MTVPVRSRRVSPALLVPILLLLGILAAVSRVDVPTMAVGVKGDESTYVSMALSAAYDGDLKFTAADLARFRSVYRAEPEGIFLKKGRSGLAALDYGKALLYPVVAAPFVRLFGLPGLLMLNVLLAALVIWCGARFARAHGWGTPGALFAAGFVLASITPIYIVWLTPEIFNFSLVFVAYFLWLYKRAPGATGSRWLVGRRSDFLAALLIGCATFSKPTHAPLVAPLVVIALFERQWRMLLAMGLAFAIGSIGLFGINALISGDANYQGGNRRTFYGRFPFSDPAATFDSLGTTMATNDSEAEDLLAPSVFWPTFRHNVAYFFVGRHAGLVPYFFPGVVAVLLWLARGRWRDPVTVVTLGALALSALALLALAPNSWSGGGGPPGNRYFLSLYPVMFFVAPATRRWWPVAAAWIGGLLFLGPLLAHPFASSKYTWQAVDTPVLRALPIELTMVDDLPVRLAGPRARIPFGSDPDVLLYFMDENAWTPEGHGVWVKGGACTEIIVRADRPLTRLRVAWHSPVANQVEASMAGRRVAMALEPGQEAIAWLRLGPGVTYTRGSRAYVLRLRTSAGFVPAEVEPGSTDLRFLGAFADLKVFDERTSR